MTGQGVRIGPGDTYRYLRVVQGDFGYGWGDIAETYDRNEALRLFREEVDRHPKRTWRRRGARRGLYPRFRLVTRRIRNE